MRTGNLAKAMGWGLFLILLLCAQIFVLHHAQMGDWGTVKSSHWFALFLPSLSVNLIVSIVPWIFVSRERKLRWALAGDDAHTPQVTLSTVKTLTPGETVTLLRASPAQIGFLIGYIGLLILPFFAFLAGGLQAISSPDLYLAHESPIGMIILALPFATGAFIALLLGWFLATNLRYTIIADDHGITVTRPLNRSHTIAWEAIHVFVCETRSRYEPLAGLYWIIGDHETVPLEIAGPGKAPYTGEPTLAYHFASVAQTYLAEDYPYTGGYSAYLAQVARILATIVTRSKIELRSATPSQTSVPFPDSMAALTGGDMLLLGTRRPSNSALAQLAQEHAVTLQQRISAREIAPPASGWWLLLTCMMVYLEEHTATSPFANMRNLLIVLLICLLLFGPLSAILVFLLRKSNRDTIRADAEGITNLRLRRSIPWSLARTWTMTPSAAGMRYQLATEAAEITWFEPHDAELAGRTVRGDRRAAYQERADQLHALITTKTGLKPTEA